MGTLFPDPAFEFKVPLSKQVPLIGGEMGVVSAQAGFDLEFG